MKRCLLLVSCLMSACTFTIGCNKQNVDASITINAGLGNFKNGEVTRTFKLNGLTRACDVITDIPTFTTFCFNYDAWGEGGSVLENNPELSTTFTPAYFIDDKTQQKIGMYDSVVGHNALTCHYFASDEDYRDFYYSENEKYCEATRKRAAKEEYIDKFNEYKELLISLLEETNITNPYVIEAIRIQVISYYFATMECLNKRKPPSSLVLMAEMISLLSELPNHLAIGISIGFAPFFKWVGETGKQFNFVIISNAIASFHHLLDENAYQAFTSYLDDYCWTCYCCVKHDISYGSEYNSAINLICLEGLRRAGNDYNRLVAIGEATSSSYCLFKQALFSQAEDSEIINIIKSLDESINNILEFK